MNRPTTPEIGELLAAPPPRFVSGDILRAAGRRAAGYQPLVVGVLLLISCIFLVMLFPVGFWKDWRMVCGGVERTKGRILSTEPMALKVNGRKVYRISFEFSPPQGRRVAGCYYSGNRWQAGQEASIEYLASDPGNARVVGGRQSEAGSWALLGLLLPAGAIGILVQAWARCRRAAYLVQYGEPARCEVEAVAPTLMSVNNLPVQRITLAWQDGTALTPLVVKHYEPAIVAFFLQKLSQKEPVMVFYDRANPKRVFFPEMLAI